LVQFAAKEVSEDGEHHDHDIEPAPQIDAADIALPDGNANVWLERRLPLRFGGGDRKSGRTPPRRRRS
jgi:hypothetical protein